MDDVAECEGVNYDPCTCDGDCDNNGPIDSGSGPESPSPNPCSKVQFVSVSQKPEEMFAQTTPKQSSQVFLDNPNVVDNGCRENPDPEEPEDHKPKTPCEAIKKHNNNEKLSRKDRELATDENFSSSKEVGYKVRRNRDGSEDSIIDLRASDKRGGHSLNTGI
ncbi:hypothetical protein ACXGQW_07865 [Wenyingzhuangia sp. IMCC45533]